MPRESGGPRSVCGAVIERTRNLEHRTFGARSGWNARSELGEGEKRRRDTTEIGRAKVGRRDELVAAAAISRSERVAVRQEHVSAVDARDGVRVIAILLH